MANYITKAREVFDNEIAGLETVRDGLGTAFEALVDQCLTIISQGGKIVLAGIGKSGHIGHKIAATLASTGSPAAFMHPVEAMHGDLGILSSKDVLIALSYSGETEELLALLPSAKRFEIPIVAITGDPASRLATWSDLVVAMTVPEEACPFNLAPTTSTTALLALGDALAMTLLDAQGFSREDYGKFHPAGSIGRSVTLRVADVMRGRDRVPIVTAELAIKDALMMMTRQRSGSVLIVDNAGMLTGIFTDGDFRRHAQDNLEVLNAEIGTVMTRDPVSLNQGRLAVSALNLLEDRQIDDIPVVDDDGHAVGSVDIQDLPKFKLM